MTLLSIDPREWFYFPIEMPLTENGNGPAKVGLDAAKITYEVWDQTCKSHGSFSCLPDAIKFALEKQIEHNRQKDDIETDMNLAVAYFKSKLPNWWYTSGDCFVSADASIGPDPNSPDWKGPDINALIDLDERFNSGFHRDVKHPYTPAQSLIDLTDAAHPVWIAALKNLEDNPGETMTFEKWKAELQKVFTAHNWPEDYVAQVDDQTWKEYFDEGISPEEMAHEEMSCGEEHIDYDG